MAMEDEEKAGETDAERRAKYRKLRAEGMQDAEAMEKVWPSTTVNRNRNILEKAEKRKAEEGKKG